MIILKSEFQIDSKTINETNRYALIVKKAMNQTVKQFAAIMSVLTLNKESKYDELFCNDSIKNDVIKEKTTDQNLYQKQN